VGRKFRKKQEYRVRYGINLVLGIVCFFLVSCFSRETGSGNDKRTYSIGINSNVKATPVIIADEKGFFTRAGLSVDVTMETTALHLLDELYAGTYDFVCVPSFLVARDYLAGKSFRILAVMNRNQSRYVLMNPDHVENPADFAGKSIGINPDGAAEFVLTRFLVLHGVNPATVAIRYHAEETLPEMLASGDVSAILTWPPYVQEARTLMDGNLLVTNAQMGVDIYWLLVTREQISRNQGPDVIRLLRALDVADAMIFEKPEEAKNLVSDRLSVSRELIDEEWNSFSFILELPQSLLVVMEQQGSWIALRDKREFNTAGLFSTINYHHLEAIFPEQVSIIR
jgi:NitT/TauT family transport system substrate-binding protein